MTAIIISASVCVPLVILCIYWERRARREAEDYEKKIKDADGWLDEFEKKIS